MIAAAAVLFAASAVIYLVGWFGRSENEAPVVGPDLDANVRAFDRMGVTR